MNRTRWIEAANEILVQARQLLQPWGVQAEAALTVREDTHSCPGYIVSENCIVFCPPVVETRIERLRWLMHRRVMGCDSVEEAAQFYKIALPYIICHELSHHLRFRAGLASPSMFVEEEACDQVCIAMLDALPQWRATLQPLRESCLHMSARLMSVVQTESAYLPSAGDVLVLRKRLSRVDLDELESLADESGMTSDALLRMAGGEHAGAMQAASHSRDLAEEYIDSRYTDDAQTYWALKLAWLAAWLERSARPDLPQMLREHILKPRHAAGTAIVSALRTVMRSPAAAQAINAAPALGTRIAAAEGYLSLVGEAALVEVVEIALASDEPERFARIALNQQQAKPANRALLLPLARACLHDPAIAPRTRLEAGALLALGIGEAPLLVPLESRTHSDEVLAAILLAAGATLEATDLPESDSARAAFLAAWQLAARPWSVLPATWREPLLQLNEPAARDNALRIVAQSSEAGKAAIAAALHARLYSGAPAGHALADMVLSRNRPLAAVTLGSMLPGRGTLQWDTALAIAREFGIAQESDHDSLRCASLGADLKHREPLSENMIAQLAESRRHQISGLLWVARQLEDPAIGQAPLRELAWVAVRDAARLGTLELIASIAPLDQARAVRRIEQGVLTRRHLAPPLLNILSGVLAEPWQARIRPLLAEQPAELAPRISDLPPIVRWVLAGIRMQGAGDLSAWLDTLELPEDSSVLDAVEKMVHLRSVPLFEGLDAEALRALAERALEQIFEPGATIVTEGEPGDRLYVVLTGHVEARSQRADGPHVLGEMGPRQVFGEMSLLDGSPRTATVSAKTVCRLLTLSRADLRPVAQRNPVIYEELLLALAAKLRAANLRDAAPSR